MNYTQPQIDAVNTIDRNLQIIACAGSGKTQVISARIVEILKRDLAKPANIIAFSFTEKAAGELKDRIDKLCHQELGSNEGLGDMFVGTIHSYCLNLLQSPPLYKYLKYDVLDEIQQRLLIDYYSQKSGMTQIPLLNGSRKLERWKDSRLYQQLLGIYSEGSIKLEAVPPTIKEGVQKYCNLLHEKRYLDYTMLIREAVEELDNNQELREIIRSQIHYLIVDEYQDVNPLQEKLIRLLHDLGANLCVVGDDDQTIYQWRGSDIKNIINFSDNYSDVVQIRLNENFRSNEGIVESARKLIEKNQKRLSKKMQSQKMQTYEQGNILALTFSNPDEEAEWIAQKINSLYGVEYQDKLDHDKRGLTYNDFAILLRVKKDASPIMSALEAAQIPYIVGGVNELFNTQEIQAIKTLFFFLADFSSTDQPPITENDLITSLSQSGFGLSSAQIINGVAFLDDYKQKIVSSKDIDLHLQSVYLKFLEHIELREESIPNRGSITGEIIYYNLGKFSQVISDFEQIHFNSAIKDLYEGFAKFLHYQASDYYPEGYLDSSYVKPDAVQIMTVHQAKGMQWPTVFVPCLRTNTFPHKAPGGLSVWHILPENCVENIGRYKPEKQEREEDERRLFYVATTRAEKYLFCSWSAKPNNKQAQKQSIFLNELTSVSSHVLTREPNTQPLLTITPQRRHTETTLALSFSELKYYFDCPYNFKLRFIYGFNEPINQTLGYGKTLHNALAEIHSKSIQGQIPPNSDIARLVEDHLHLPFANEPIRQNVAEVARRDLERYLNDHRADLDKLEHVEKTIELRLDDGIMVNGRIDLIRRTDTNEHIIVDFKSNKKAQSEDITRRQLQVYALGYQQLTGNNADLIEIHNMDNGGSEREVVDNQLIDVMVNEIKQAGNSLKNNQLIRLQSWCNTCETCKFKGICRTKK